MDSKRSRLEAFSDGVAAIAITLLALELKVPHLINQGISRSSSELIPLLPTVLTFLLSFATIAIFWVNHHLLTQHITYIGRRIVWANVLFLLFITLIPFATKTVGDNPENTLAILIYSLVLFLCSVSFTLLRLSIHGRGKLQKKAFRRGLVGPIVYGITSFLVPFIGIFSYILLAIPPFYYFLPRETVEN